MERADARSICAKSFDGAFKGHVVFHAAASFARGNQGWQMPAHRHHVQSHFEIEAINGLHRSFVAAS